MGVNVIPSDLSDPLADHHFVRSRVLALVRISAASAASILMRRGFVLYRDVLRLGLHRK